MSQVKLYVETAKRKHEFLLGQKEAEQILLKMMDPESIDWLQIQDSVFNRHRIERVYVEVDE